MILFNLYPNSPQYFITKNDLTKAKNALKFYKGTSDHEVITKELESLQSIESQRSMDKKLHFGDICMQNLVADFYN